MANEGFHQASYQPVLLVPEASIWLDTDSYWFPSYFKIFLNVGFALCFLPFHIKHEHVSDNINRSFAVISQNLLQKAITALIHIFLLAHSTITVSSFLTMKLREKPSNLFTIVRGFTVAGVLVAFLYTGWRKQEAFRELAHVFKPPGSKMPRKVIGVLFAIAVIPIFDYIFSIVHAAFELQNESKLQTTLAFNLWALWLRNSSMLNISQGEVITDPTLKYIGYTGIAVDYLLYNFICLSSAVFVFIGAISVREIVSKYLALFQSENAKKMSLQALSDLYLRMEKQIAFVNVATGPLTLGWFAYTVSFFLDIFFNIFSAADVALKAINFATVVYHVAVLLVAADAHSKTMECESILIERGSSKYSTEKQWSPAFMAYLEMSQVDMGLRGSDFFVISHKFIGSTVGMMVTYLLVMLQFNLELQLQPSTLQNSTLLNKN